MWSLFRRIFVSPAARSATGRPTTEQTTIVYVRVPASRADIDSAAGQTETPGARSPVNGSASLPVSSMAAQHEAGSRAPLKRSSRRRRAIRFAKRFEDMTPRQAAVLHAIHRRGMRSLASESPGPLRRDWFRFQQSSRGRKICGQRSLPELCQLRSWIQQAREVAGSACEPSRRSAA